MSYFLSTASLQLASSNDHPLATDTVDDYPGDMGGNTVIAIGGPAQHGVIETIADVDTFIVVLSANHRYRFQLEPGSPTLNYSQLGLRDSNDISVAHDSGGGKYGSTVFEYTAPVSGTYYLFAAGASSSGTGPYTVLTSLVSTPPPVQPEPPPPVTPMDDHPASNSTAGVVAVDGSLVFGQLERSGDIDYIRVVLEANATYTFSVESQAGELDTYLRVRDQDGRELAHDDDGAGSKTGGSRINFTAPTRGDYFLEVSSDAQHTGHYMLSALSDDFPANAATTGVLSVNDPAIHGAIEYQRDVDWIRIDLSAGVLYEVQVDGEPGYSGSALSLPGYTLRSADGVAVNTGGRTDGGPVRVHFVASTGGPHYIAAHAQNSIQTGNYRVGVTTVTDDLPSSAATTGVVQVNGPASTGTIDATRDTDFFKVALVGGTLYRFELSGTGALADTYLRLLGQDGAELAANDDAGSKHGSAGLTFKAPASGTYYLEASGNQTHIGGYQLSGATALAATATAPHNGAVEVPRSTDIVLKFDRPVQANEGRVNIHVLHTRGVINTIRLDDTSQVSIDGSTVTINPTRDLPAGSRFFITVDNGALKDAHGNLSEGMTQDTLLSFATSAANSAPVAADHAFSVTQGVTVNGRLPTAIDADADTVFYDISQGPRQGKVVIQPDGRFTYEAPVWFAGTEIFSFVVHDSGGATSFYTARINVATLPEVNGTAQADTLAPATGSNRYVGMEDNDVFTTGAGFDIVDGGAGIDTLVVPGPRSASTLERRLDNGWQVQSPPGTDVLINVERLRFDDTRWAIDMSGNAGLTVKALGAVLGKAQATNAAFIGIGLGLLDSGMQTLPLMQFALNAALGTESPSNAAVVDLLYTNLTGVHPGATESAYFSGLITSGQASQASLALMAAEHDLNLANIGWIELVGVGVGYV